MPSRSAVRLTTFRPTGLATGGADPGSILRYRMTFVQPSTSSLTSPATTGPERPASAVIDGLPRVEAVPQIP
jgi:hypothetical protein